MASRIAPSFLHPYPRKWRDVVRRLQAGLLTLLHLKQTFPSRSGRTVVLSAKHSCVSLRHVPYFFSKVQDYSGGTVPDFHGIPFYTLSGTCVP